MGHTIYGHMVGYIDWLYFYIVMGISRRSSQIILWRLFSTNLIYTDTKLKILTIKLLNTNYIPIVTLLTIPT